jgi:hypothetical protein
MTQGAGMAHETVLFVHVPKTAGTTLRELVQEQVGEQDVFIIRHGIQASRQELRAMHESERAELRAIYGHMCWGWHSDLPGQPQHAYVTMLRDPAERVLSLYAHSRVSGHYLHEHARHMDLTTYLVSGVTRTADNGMVRQLTDGDDFLQQPYADMVVPFRGVTRAHLDTAKRHLDECAVVGVSEQFPHFIERMNERFGWTVRQWINLNKTRWWRPRLADLSAAERRVLDHSTALDRELYEHALSIVEGQ